MRSNISFGLDNAMTVMVTIWGTLARHMPAYAVRGIEADLRAVAGVRKRAGDCRAYLLISDLADSLVASRPELFGH